MKFQLFLVILLGVLVSHQYQAKLIGSDTIKDKNVIRQLLHEFHDVIQEAIGEESVIEFSDVDTVTQVVVPGRVYYFENLEYYTTNCRQGEEECYQKRTSKKFCQQITVSQAYKFKGTNEGIVATLNGKCVPYLGWNESTWRH